MTDDWKKKARERVKEKEQANPSLSANDEREITARLRVLGYLG